MTLRPGGGSGSMENMQGPGGRCLHSLPSPPTLAPGTPLLTLTLGAAAHLSGRQLPRGQHPRQGPSQPLSWTDAYKGSGARRPDLTRSAGQVCGATGSCKQGAPVGGVRGGRAPCWKQSTGSLAPGLAFQTGTEPPQLCAAGGRSELPPLPRHPRSWTSPWD